MMDLLFSSAEYYDKSSDKIITLETPRFELCSTTRQRNMRVYSDETRLESIHKHERLSQSIIYVHMLITCTRTISVYSTSFCQVSFTLTFCPTCMETCCIIQCYCDCTVSIVTLIVYVTDFVMAVSLWHK